MTSSAILDQHGRPFTGESKTALRRAVTASYDLSKTTAHNRKHWAAADSLAARAAMTPAIRAIVRKRSRYEFDNNSWYSGILRTAANHIVGSGPRLQVLTDHVNGNNRLERAWRKWSRQIMFADILRMMFETYWKDGEVFAMKTNRPSRHPIDLDIRTYEAEQCAAPWMGSQIGDPFVDDGIRIDPNNNEVEYYFYKNHPGDVTYTPTLAGEWFPAKQVVHLVRKERPGQVRGIPRATSSLNTLPVMRRQEMSTLLASETAANLATYMKSTGPSVQPGLMPKDFIELEIAYNMLTTLPEGWDIAQVDGKHPGPQYEMFQRQALTSFCRCTNMPYALAAGTSRDSNFSSLKGDVKNVWEPEVKVEQDRIELSVVEVIWGWFLEEAIYVPGLLDGLPPIDSIDHKWTWQPLPNLDEVDSAAAAEKRLQSGQSNPSDEYNRVGKDYETEISQMAKDYGKTVDEVKGAMFDAIFKRQPTMPAALSRSTDAEVSVQAFTDDVRDGVVDTPETEEVTQ